MGVMANSGKSLGLRLFAAQVATPIAPMARASLPPQKCRIMAMDVPRETRYVAVRRRFQQVQELFKTTKLPWLWKRKICQNQLCGQVLRAVNGAQMEDTAAMDRSLAPLRS